MTAHDKRGGGMPAMIIDFAGAQSPWRRDRRMPGVRIALVLLALALLAGGAALQRGLQVRQELAQLHQTLELRRAETSRASAAQRDRDRLGSADEPMLRQAALQRAVPWEAIFRAFERAPAARLESFEPDVARGVVKVQANLADVGAMQDYLAALQANPVFLRVNLLRHEALADGGGLNFQYEAVLAGPYRLPEPTTRSAP